MCWNISTNYIIDPILYWLLYVKIKRAIVLSYDVN